MGAVLLGLAAWTRSELFWIIPAFIYSLKNIFKFKLKELIIFLLILIPLTNLWPASLQSQLYLYFQGSSSLPVEVAKPILIITQQIYTIKHYNFSLIVNVIAYFSGSFVRSWGIILPIFILVTIVESLLYKRILEWLPIVTYALTAAIVLGIVNFAHVFPDWQILDNSVYRMATMVIPLFWVCILTSKVQIKLINILKLNK